MRASEKAALVETIGAFIADRLKSAHAPLLDRLSDVEARPPERGENGAPGADGVAGCDGLAGKEGPAGRDGANGTVDPEVLALAVEDAVAKLPPPAAGIDGVDGKEGPAGRDGAPGAVAPEAIARAVDDAVAKLPPAQDGKDGDPGRDGRDGQPGRDGKDGEPGKSGENGKDGADGIHGKDGLGFDDLMVEFDGERTATLRFVVGDRVKEFPIKFPVIIDRGVWKEGAYERGDAVSWGGSLHIAKTDTATKPDTPDSDWRLSAKRGRDGKEGKPGARGEPGTAGRNGRDLTQMGPDGAKW